MNVLDILTGPWAIIPAKLNEIQQVYFKHSRGEKIDLATVEAEIGPLNNKDDNYRVVNNVAVVSLHGIMAKRMNLFSRISGGVSTELVMRDIGAALKDPKIKGIVLDIDSPGGAIDGTLELANFIFEGRSQKKIIAYSNGVIGSAAYWVGSAAHEVYISGDTVQSGSIGIVAKHIDYSKQEEKEGVKITEIVSGKYKRLASSHKPLSDEGLKNIQGMTDYLYTVFVDSVAKFRGATPDVVLESMADGRIFIGRQGITAGLVDDVSSIDQLIAQISNRKKEASMDLEQLKAEHPDLYAKIQSDTRESVTAEFDVEREQFKIDAVSQQEQIDTLTATNDALEATNTELGDENKELGKRMVSLEQKDDARDLKDAIAAADKIFVDALAGSRIPSKHFERVQRGVAFADFFKDGEFDTKGYTEAVAAEIVDWEKDISPAVVGAGFVGRSPAEGSQVEDEEEDAMVGEMVAMVEK